MSSDCFIKCLDHVKSTVVELELFVAAGLLENVNTGVAKWRVVSGHLISIKIPPFVWCQ